MSAATAERRFLRRAAATADVMRRRMVAGRCMTCGARVSDPCEPCHRCRQQKAAGKGLRIR